MPAYDFGFVSLDIQWVNSEDSGVYTCRATNDYGEDSTSAIVKCKGENREMSDQDFHYDFNSDFCLFGCTVHFQLAGFGGYADVVHLQGIL